MALPSSVTRVRSAFMLDGPLRKAIHRFKYLGEHKRGRDLALRLEARLPVLLEHSGGIDVIVPVPLHVRRFRQRGFNQSEILAEPLARALDVPVVRAVHRARHTESQTRLSWHERARNVDGAFELDARSWDQLKDARVLLVDDVTTTGATLGAAARALEGAQLTSITGLTLAREG